MFRNNDWSTMIADCITKFFISLILVSLACFIIVYRWKRRHLYKLGAQLPGLPAFPIIGNALELRGSPEEVMSKLLTLAKEYTTLSRIWFGPSLIIYVTKHEDIQIILNSSKNINKPYFYRFLQPVLQNGMVTTSGDVWHRHRRIIAPAFNTKMLELFVKVFNKYSMLLVHKLRPHSRGDQFDIGKYIHLTILDIICETAFGADESISYKLKSESVEAHARISDIIHERIFKVWMHPDFIFNQFYGTELKPLVQQFLRLPNMMIEEKRKEYKLKKDNGTEGNSGKKTKSKSFIDILLELVESGADFTIEEVRDEAATVMTAGHDTSAQAVSFCVLMLALHQDIQEKVYDELAGIFGESDREITMEDLKQLVYTEMVVKETLRMYPPIPLFLRKIEEDVELSSHTLPAGCSVLIAPLAVHMDPKVYPNPDQFNPENFSPEGITNRHRCSFLPFSAGPRSCIGQSYSMLTMKTTVAYLVRNYRFFTDIEINKIKLKSDILLRSAIGFPVKIVAREQLQTFM